MKKFKFSLIILTLILAACGDEKIYSAADFQKDPELVDKVITRYGRAPSEISAQNLKNAKAWFPEKFEGRKSNFEGIFKNAN